MFTSEPPVIGIARETISRASEVYLARLETVKGLAPSAAKLLAVMTASLVGMGWLRARKEPLTAAGRGVMT